MLKHAKHWHSPLIKGGKVKQFVEENRHNKTLGISQTDTNKDSANSRANYVSNNKGAIKAIKTCDKKHMAAVIEKLMYLFCRENKCTCAFLDSGKMHPRGKINVSALQKRHRDPRRNTIQVVVL